MMADMFRARGHEIVSGCGSGGPEDGPDADGAKSASYLVYESKGRRTAVLCCVGTAAWSVDWLKECCRLTGASSSVLVSDTPPQASLEDAWPELEFWDMDRVVSEMRNLSLELGSG